MLSVPKNSLQHHPIRGWHVCQDCSEVSNSSTCAACASSQTYPLEQFVPPLPLPEGRQKPQEPQK